MDDQCQRQADAAVPRMQSVGAVAAHQGRTQDDLLAAEPTGRGAELMDINPNQVERMIRAFERIGTALKEQAAATKQNAEAAEKLAAAAQFQAQVSDASSQIMERGTGLQQQMLDLQKEQMQDMRRLHGG